MKPVFVFSPPRSGSTLLMRILATCPGAVFGGETNHFLWEAKKLHDYWNDYDAKAPNGRRSIDDQVAHGILPAWCRRGERPAWDSAVRGLLEAWGGAARATSFWGWKEVATGARGHGGELWDWMQGLMPECELVFLLRDPGATLASILGKGDWFKWMGNCAVSKERTLMKQVEGMVSYAARNPRVRRVEFKDLTDFDRLQSALGSVATLDRAGWEETVKVKV